jgi:glyoxylase-like metal-dependent hydrolase (beta-lactamase superfamily II)
VVGDRATREAVVIDPGGDADELTAAVAARGLRVTAIVATHAHFDHVLAARRLQELLGAPFLLHRDDLPLLSWLQESGRLWLGVELPPPPEVDDFPVEGDVIVAGGVELDVLHTPGHSPGSISLVGGGSIFSGDTLFAGSVGRTDLPGGSSGDLLGAIRTKLFALDDALAVHPGHGPATTLGDERRSNPFVGESSRLWLPPK